MADASEKSAVTVDMPGRASEWRERACLVFSVVECFGKFSVLSLTAKFV